jgi:DNA-binding response OmpR family regulator
VWVLVVEDERRMAELLRKGLEREGMTAALAFDGPTGLEAARTRDYDAIVLDVMLPGLDGVTVARRLRAEAIATPILLLTARDTTADIVKGLTLGADDYLTKPFAFDVLLARLRALVRRRTPGVGVQLSAADLVLDPVTREVLRANQRLLLTRTEFQLLEVLLRRKGRVVPRQTLIEAVWGWHKDVEPNTLEVFIRQLRSKVDQDFEPKLIQTIRGIGYSLREGGANE